MTETQTIDMLEKIVRAAAVAGGWTALALVVFIVFQWLVYLFFMHTRPAWLLWMWGPNVDWPLVQMLWFWVIVALKFVLWMIVLASLWLTVWANLLLFHFGALHC